MTSKELTLAICKVLSDKKGKDIVYIDVEQKTSLCDYFVLVSGNSSTQVKSLAEHVEEQMEKNFDLAPTRLEGVHDGRWAVLDYGDVMLHIFSEDAREFYRLERLWEDGENLTKFTDYSFIPVRFESVYALARRTPSAVCVCAFFPPNNRRAQAHFPVFERAF